MSARSSGILAALRRWLDRSGQASHRERDSRHGGPYRARADVSAVAAPTARIAPGALLAFDVREGGELNRTVLVDRAATTIELGRQATCHVRLEHPAVSRMHAVVTVIEPAVLYAGGLEAAAATDTLEIIDLGGAAGTRLNGKLVNRRAARLGDVIEIGTFRVTIGQRFGKPGVYLAAEGPSLPPAAP